MNNHPDRETDTGKPSRPPHEDEEGKPDAPDGSESQAAPRDGQAAVGPIDRKTAEQGIPPDPDPDDPASP